MQSLYTAQKYFRNNPVKGYVVGGMIFTGIWEYYGTQDYNKYFRHYDELREQEWR